MEGDVFVLRFKLFSGGGAALQDEVNAWLSEFEPDVTQMVQTVGADGVITISVLFDESFRGQEMRVAVESGISRATGPSIPEDSMPDKPIHVPQEPGQYTSEGFGDPSPD